MKHRLVIFGSSAFGLPAFSVMAKHPAMEVVGVISQPDRPQGRHHELTPTPVSAWARESSLPLWQFPSLQESAIQERLAALRPDIALVAAYGLILPSAVLSIPSRGCINIHGSLLPRHRGASPIAAAIAEGDAMAGISYMLMDAGVDTGPVIHKYALPLHADITHPELEQALSDLAGKTIQTAIDGWLDGTYVPVAQDNQLATRCSRLTKEDGRAHWDSGRRLSRLIRAYTPWPGVWTEWNGQAIKLLAATYEATTPTAKPGTVVQLEQRRWGIMCGDGIIVPSLVQFPGKKPQPAATVPGSYPTFIGTQLN
ncbi:MAG: methionyl-tRNA formyltransferase [Candidatus Kerfeldbacteria bacterium]|nr:methionyl-tRNA formyltransferase [Candidatus Kerfeldbacteria bacterium]